MRERFSVACLFCPLLLAPSPAWAGKVSLTSVVERLDVTTLVPILNRGEVSLVESWSNGSLKQATVIGLVQAPPSKVWSVLTDYAHYMDFMPSLANFEITKHDGDDVIAAYEIEVPGPNIEYRLRHHPVPPNRIDVSLADEDGDILTGAWRWELVPYSDGKATIVVYTLYTDVRESSWIVRQVLKSQPTMEHALNVATGLITIQAVKKRAEK